MSAEQSVAGSLDSLFEEERWLIGLARRLIGNDSAAQDLVQDTWLVALENPPTNLVEPRKWLLTVALRLARKRKERRTPQLLGELEGLASEVELPEHAAQRWEAAKMLREAVDALEERQREVVLLVHQEGLGQAEVARLLDTSTRAVRRRLAGAYHGIKVHLGGNERAARTGSWVIGIAPIFGRKVDWTSAGASTASSGVLFGVLVAGAVLVVGGVALFETELGADGQTDGTDVALVVPRESEEPDRGSPEVIAAERAALEGRQSLGAPPPVAASAPPPERSAGSASAEPSAPEAKLRFSGRLLIGGAAPEGFQAVLLAHGFFPVHDGIDGEVQDVGEDGTFTVEAREPGAWDLLLRARGQAFEAGLPTFVRRFELPPAPEAEVRTDVPATRRVTVLTEDHGTIWLWRPEGPEGWEYKSNCAVTGGAARFESVPEGYLQVRSRPDDEVVDYGDFELLWKGWVEGEDRVVDLRP